MKYIIGGIGDFLQSLDDAQKEKIIKVYSHFLQGASFFKPFDINVNFSYFKDRSSLEACNLSFAPVQKKLFQDFLTPEKSLELAMKNSRGKGSIIGLHPVGSKFSNDIYLNNNIPLKIIPPKTLKKIVNKDNYYFIFGSKEELIEYKKEIQGSNIHWVDYDDIWDSLAHVPFCRRVFGIDSSIKTMASVKRVFSVVLVGNFRDDFRDDHFITPYVNEGVMKVFKFNNILEQEDEIINFFNNYQ